MPFFMVVFFRSSGGLRINELYLFYSVARLLFNFRTELRLFEIGLCLVVMGKLLFLYIWIILIYYIRLLLYLSISGNSVSEVLISWKICCFCDGMPGDDFFFFVKLYLGFF